MPPAFTGRGLQKWHRNFPGLDHHCLACILVMNFCCLHLLQVQVISTFKVWIRSWAHLDLRLSFQSLSHELLANHSGLPAISENFLFSLFPPRGKPFPSHLLIKIHPFLQALAQISHSSNYFRIEYLSSICSNSLVSPELRPSLILHIKSISGQLFTYVLSPFTRPKALKRGLEEAVLPFSLWSRVAVCK